MTSNLSPISCLNFVIAVIYFISRKYNQEIKEKCRQIYLFVMHVCVQQCNNIKDTFKVRYPEL